MLPQDEHYTEEQIQRQIEAFREDFELKSPVATIVLYAGFELPMQGWEFCDGSELSRVEFAGLFSNIGTFFGEGDGETTFNLPKIPPLRLESVTLSALVDFSHSLDVNNGKEA